MPDITPAFALSNWAARLDQIVREMRAERGPAGLSASHKFGVCMSQIVYAARDLQKLAQENP